ncbi:MAG: DUF4143 domain-containing protein [Planctomycetota bacterium]
MIWRDSGLFHFLMGVRDCQQLFSQPWVGSGWESFVIEQTLSSLAAQGKAPQCFYFRTADGYELNLVLDWGVELWAVEIKLTSDPTRHAIARLNRVADMIGAKRRVLVCRTHEPIENGTVLVTNLANWLAELT